MSVRRTNAVLLVVALSVLVGVLYLAGCFERKMGAAATTRTLMRTLRARKVVCRHGSDGWDYSCSIVARNGAKLRIDVDVNSNSITSQSAP